MVTGSVLFSRFFLFPSSRASRSCRAPREISCSPRLAHKAPVMQTSPHAHHISIVNCLFTRRDDLFDYLGETSGLACEILLTVSTRGSNLTLYKYCKFHFLLCIDQGLKLEVEPRTLKELAISKTIYCLRFAFPKSDLPMHFHRRNGCHGYNANQVIIQREQNTRVVCDW